MFFSFFFQAEDGIRDSPVTGVQTCALPIYAQYSFDKLEPCFGLLKSLGKNIQQVMGESQTNRWVTDQIITVDGPDAVRLFMDILRNLLEHQIKQGLGDRFTES